MYVCVQSRTAGSNNAVEGWHNAFKSGVNCPHPSFIQLLSHLQKEQSFQVFQKLARREMRESSMLFRIMEIGNTFLLTWGRFQFSIVLYSFIFINTSALLLLPIRRDRLHLHNNRFAVVV